MVTVTKDGVSYIVPQSKVNEYVKDGYTITNEPKEAKVKAKKK